MERDYSNGTRNDVTFFIGTEVEHTPAHGRKTLFVVGVHDPKIISYMASQRNCDHIFIGANQCFNPIREVSDTRRDLDDVMDGWDGMMKPLLEQGLLVTLDFDASLTELVLETGWCEYNNFIPQISVKIPYIRQLNYNAMLKIDDRDFKATNPGVWCHRLHDLMDSKRFTDWREYGKDEPL